MNNQVKQCLNLEILNSEITCVDSTPIKANTKFNNPKCFSNNKFKSSNQPKSDLDCKLGIHSANNQDTHKKHQFYWGYKSLIICDAKSGLPIYEETCTADKSDVSSFIGFMKRANKSFSLVNSIVIADKGFDSKKNYNYIKNDLNGTAIIAKNKRNTKNSKSLAEGNLICQAGLAMHKDGKQYLKDSISKAYGKKGEKVVNMNYAAIDKGLESLVKIDVPESWKSATGDEQKEIYLFLTLLKIYVFL